MVCWTEFHIRSWKVKNTQKAFAKCREKHSECWAYSIWKTQTRNSTGATVINFQLNNDDKNWRQSFSSDKCNDGDKEHQKLKGDLSWENHLEYRSIIVSSTLIKSNVLSFQSLNHMHWWHIKLIDSLYHYKERNDPTFWFNETNMARTTNQLTRQHSLMLIIPGFQVSRKRTIKQLLLWLVSAHEVCNSISEHYTDYSNCCPVMDFLIF